MARDRPNSCKLLHTSRSPRQSRGQSAGGTLNARLHGGSARPSAVSGATAPLALCARRALRGLPCQLTKPMPAPAECSGRPPQAAITVLQTWEADPRLCRGWWSTAVAACSVAGRAFWVWAERQPFRQCGKSLGRTAPNVCLPPRECRKCMYVWVKLPRVRGICWPKPWKKVLHGFCMRAEAFCPPGRTLPGKRQNLCRQHWLPDRLEANSPSVIIP